jgi:hypothetical protein
MLLRALETARVIMRTHALLSHTLPPVGDRKRLSCTLLPNGSDITSNFLCEVTVPEICQMADVPGFAAS